MTKMEKNKRKRKHRHTFLKLILIIPAVIILLIGWGIFSSYNVLTVTEYEVCSDKLAGEMNIVLISDLHDHSFGRSNAALAARIRKLQPDLILMIGDFLNSDSPDAHVPLELIPQLADIAPVYYSIGNQEEEYVQKTEPVSVLAINEDSRDPEVWWDVHSDIDWEKTQLYADLEAAGAIVLDKDYINIQMNGNDLVLGGMYDYAFAFNGGGHMDKSRMPGDTLDFLESFQAEPSFKIMMAHRPDSFLFSDAEDTWDIDLVLSGHLHGGHVIIPFKGGLYGGDFGWFPKYAFGEFHFSAVKTMIITRGLGSGHQKIPRFNNMPEIVVVRLLGN